MDGALRKTPVMLFLDSSGCTNIEAEEFEEQLNEEGSKYNPGEARVAVRRVEILLRSGLHANQICVITPYSAQVSLIRTLLRGEKTSHVEVRTVDGFQGQEREVVILSLVRSNRRGEVGFLRDHRRLNVAVTRARRHVTIIGDSGTVSSDKFVASLLSHTEKHGEVRFVMDVDDDDYDDDVVVVAKVLEKEEDETKKTTEILEQIQDFARRADKETDDLKRLRMFHRFSRSLSSFDRRVVHEECEKLSLSSSSRGQGAFRFVTIQPKARVVVVAPEVVKKNVVVEEEDRVSALEDVIVEVEKKIVVEVKEVEKIPDKTNPIQIKIRYKGKSHELDFDCSYRATMNDLRKRLETLTTVPVHDQKLIFKGKKWLPEMSSDMQSLATMGLKDGSRLMLMSGGQKLVTSLKKNSTSSCLPSSCHVQQIKSKPVSSAASRLREASKARIERNRRNRVSSKKTAARRKAADDTYVLDAAAAQSGKCAFLGCTFKSTSLYGLLCTECRQRFCPTHQVPESHGCGSQSAHEARLRARKAAERIRSTGRAAPPAALPEWKRNALRRQLHKKIDEKNSNRTGVDSKEKKKNPSASGGSRERKKRRKKKKKPPGV